MIVILAGLLLFLSSNTTVAALIQYHDSFINTQPVLHQSTNDDVYTGRLRIYVVEPNSRWSSEGTQFHFGFFDFVATPTLSIPYQGIYKETFRWDALQAGYSDVTEDNVMVIASVFNPEIHPGIIELAPYYENQYFDAYYVDATAAATPGKTGYNTVNQNFTHTVLCEESTGEGCGSCPPTAAALQAIYESHDYPFYYVSFVAENPMTRPRLNEFFTNGEIYTPVCFFDGGYRVNAGGWPDEEHYRSKIEACGRRDPHDLNLTVSLDWLENGLLQINVSIKNIEHTPPDILEIGDIVSGYNGFGQGGNISVEIRNKGNTTLANVQWNISIMGGIARRIHIFENDSIYLMENGSSFTIRTTSPIFGLGKVTILVTANEKSRRTQGFLIGSFLFLKRNT